MDAVEAVVEKYVAVFETVSVVVNIPESVLAEETVLLREAELL